MEVTFVVTLSHWLRLVRPLNRANGKKCSVRGQFRLFYYNASFFQSEIRILE